MSTKISSALISVFDKTGLEPIVQRMMDLNITMYSTGGTQEFIEKLGGKVVPVEELTGYPRFSVGE